MAKTVIIMQTTDGQGVVELFGNLKRLCDNTPEISYHSVKGNKFPFTYGKWTITKTKIK